MTPSIDVSSLDSKQQAVVTIMIGNVKYLFKSEKTMNVFCESYILFDKKKSMFSLSNKKKR